MRSYKNLLNSFKKAWLLILMIKFICIKIMNGHR
nr:MAG TPA: hypothetical protein [Caudoviricetes sp.]